MAEMAGSQMHTAAAAGPVTKRQKVHDALDNTTPRVRQSKIFAPFRVSRPQPAHCPS